MNNALGVLSYTSNPGYTGPDTLAIRVDDPGTLAVGTGTATASIGIAVQAPTLTAPASQSTYTGGTLTFAPASGDAITVGDSAGAATPLTVSLSVTGGTLALAQTTGLTFTAGTGSGAAQMTFTGVAANVNAALAGLTYTPTAGTSGPDALTVTVDDPSTLAAGGGTASAAIDIAVNAPPAVAVPGVQATQMGTPLTFSAEAGNAITIAYPTINNAPLTVSLSVAQGTLSLGEVGGLTFAQGTGTGDTAETFTGTVADINAALDGLTYTPTGGYYGGDTLSIRAYDPAVAGGSRNPATGSLALAVQTVPFAYVPDDQSTPENQALTFSAADGNAITVGDTGPGNTELTVTLSVGDGTLTLVQTTGLAITAGTATASAAVTFTGLASAIDSALDGLVYTPTANVTGTDTLTVSCDDPQSAANGLTDSEQVGIAVAAPGAALTGVTISDPSISTSPLDTDDQTPLTLSSDDGDNIVIAEPNPNAVLTVTLSVADGTLALSQTSNLTFTQGTGTGNAVMTFSGTQANVDAALDGLTYTPNTTFAGTDTIAVSGGGVSMSIPVTVTYPAPTVTVPAAMTVNAGTPVAFPATASSPAGIASYQWSINYANEGYVVNPSLTTLTPTYTFAHYGPYDVLLTVTAKDGQVAQADIPVTVAEVAPTATVTDSGPVAAGQSETFTVGVTDPDALDNVTVLADWTGSGTFQQVDASQMTVNGNGTLSFTHEYDDTPAGGTADNAVIEVVDDGGQTNTYNATVTVTSPSPAGTLGAAATITGPNGKPTGYTDPNGNPIPWAITPGTPFVFTAVTDPSPPGSGGLTYHWTVTANPQLGGAAATTTVTADPQFELPGADYADGTVLKVTGWISYTAADGQVAASAPQTVYTFVLPGASGVGYLHGTLLPANLSRPPEYDPYTGSSVSLSIPANQLVTVRFQLDPASLMQATATKPLKYVVAIDEITGGTVQVRSETSSSPTLVVGSFPDNCTITIAGYATCGGLMSLKSYGVTLTTPQTQPPPPPPASTIDNVLNALSLVQTLGTQFGSAGAGVVTAIGTSPSAFFNNLVTGLTGAVSTFIAGLPQQIPAAGLTWLGAQNLPNIQTITGPNALTSFLLQYAGLTWANVQSTLMQALGSNAAAVTTVANWVSKYNTSDPGSLITFLESGAVPDFNPQALIAKMDGAFNAILKQAATSAVQSLAAKFAPGAGVVGALYQGFTWLLNNQNQLSAVVSDFLGSLNQLAANNTTGFRNGLLTALNNSIPALIGLAASQLGLGNLPATIQKALQFVPTQVNQALTAAVVAVVNKLPLSGGGTGTSALYAGLLSPVVGFTYQGTQYQLWVSKVNGQGAVKGVVKVAQVVGGRPQFLKVLTAADFTNSAVTTATADINALVTAAGAAATASTLPKPPAKPPASQLATMQAAAQALPTAEQQVIKDILANACLALNAGCFAAGTRLWTPDGYRNVEDIRPGERVWSRSEFDPAGPVEAKAVEAVFVRLGRILHLHFADGELIRTTPEHPFFVEGRGWTAAGALTAGDRVATRSGEWVPISEVFDTEQWEAVYNLRVADFHTYFVSEEGWGFTVWAHNDYNRLVDVLRGAPDVKSTDDATLLAIAKRMPQGKSARSMSEDAFTKLLETKLRNKGLLGNGESLSVETADAALEAAEVHGNTGRSPTIVIDPSASNPYTVGTIAARQWDAIQTLYAANPTVTGILQLREQLPGGSLYARNRGLPYELARAQAYAASGELVGVEVPVGGGQADLLLTHNRLVDAKAWSPIMWQDASSGKKAGMLLQLALEVAKYLGPPGSPTPYTLEFQFKYAIPAEVSTALAAFVATTPSYSGRLTWTASVN